MDKHKDKFHKIVSALSQSPLATSVRTLFRGDNIDDTIGPSTQGGSDGSVNSLKVITGGTFQCNECPEERSRKNDLMTHIVTTHNKAQAAPSNDKDNSATEDDLEGDEEGLREIAEAMGNTPTPVENMIELGNLITIDKIVDSFVDTAFHEINPNIAIPKPVCHECTLKDVIFNNREDMINEKDCLIVERNATVKGLMDTIKTMTKEKTELIKKVKETDNLKKTVAEKNKEISNMKVAITTKNDMLAAFKAQADNLRQDTRNDNSNEVTVEAEVKKCKKCVFTAPNMQILGLHMENDHEYEFQCSDCNKKFPFKNQLKMHRRETHEQGTYSCFVCSSKFKTHKELKQHIQRRCKTNNTTSPPQIVHKHNEDIHKEDEHKCPKCPKITNNQVSLVNHINTMHITKTEKCDNCGMEYQSREELIKHIVEIHTNQGVNIIQRHICKVCNVELNGDNNRDTHICRKPEWCCTWCKKEFYSSEAKKKSYL